jgi:poly(hydroxyalkanoate) granule-associated protein
MRVFDSLVRQGEAVETRTRRAATDTAAAARHAAHTKAREMQQMAGGTWDKLEKVFEERVARALSRLGVHTQSDVDRLAARVDALSEAVNQLIKSSGGKPARRSESSSKRLAKGAAPTSARSTTGAGRRAMDTQPSAADDATGAASATTRKSSKGATRGASKAGRGISK